MQQKLTIKLLPSEASDILSVKKIIANTTGKKIRSVSGYHILREPMNQSLIGHEFIKILFTKYFVRNSSITVT